MYGNSNQDNNNESNTDYQKYEDNQNEEEEEYVPQSTNQTLGQNFQQNSNNDIDETTTNNQNNDKVQYSEYNPDNQQTTDDYEQTPQPQIAGSSNLSHLDLSQVQIDMLMYLSPENFQLQLNEDIKKCNTGATDLDISANMRVQEVKSTQYLLRMLNLGILGLSFLMWMITCIIYSQMFKYPVQGFAQFLFITAQIVWILQIAAIGFSAKIFNILYMKILFLVNAGIFAFVFLGFCIAASRIAGGYVFYLLLELTALGGKQYGLFMMVRKMEQLQERFQ